MIEHTLQIQNMHNVKPIMNEKLYKAYTNTQ